MKNQREMKNGGRIKILYLEDNPDDVFLLEKILQIHKDEFEMVSVSTEQDFRTRLIAKDPHHYPDVILSDFDLNGFTGLEALNLVRKQDTSMPFIFLTGSMGDERAVQLMNRGANDFILKENVQKVPQQIIKLLEQAKVKREKIQYQTELEHKNNILRTLLESMEDLIFLKDNEKRYVMVNQAMCKHFKIEMGRFIGAKDEELFPESIHHKSLESDNYVLKNKKPILFEHEFGDGENRVVLETLKTPLQNKEGIAEGIVGVSRDISLKKNQQEKFKRQDKLLNEAEKHASSGSFQYNSKNDRLIGSRQFHKMLDLPQSTEGVSLSIFISKIYQSEKSIFVKNILDAINSGTNFSMDHRIIGHRGSIMAPTGGDIIHCRTTLTPSEKRGVFYGTVKDIQEERRNKKAIIDAQENERRDLAADLHDSLTQKLVAANMYLSSMEEHNMSLDRIRTAGELIRSGLDEVRTLTRSLSLHNFENLGLKSALLEIIESFPTETIIDHEFDFDENILNRDVAIALYRVIQEALTNIMKYAKATVVGVIIKPDGDSLKCKIIDDGIGFDVEIEEARGNGLKNIRQRILRCNGILKISSSTGEGTTLDISVPYH